MNTSQSFLNCLRNAQRYLIISELLQFCLQVADWQISKMLSFWISSEFSFFFRFEIYSFLFFSFFLFFYFFAFEPDIFLGLFLNFEQNWASCSYKIVLIAKFIESITYDAAIAVSPLSWSFGKRIIVWCYTSTFWTFIMSFIYYILLWTCNKIHWIG